MKTLMRTLLKPLSLALFVAATLPTQNACNRTSSSSNPPTQNAQTQTSPSSDTIPATSPSPYFCKAIGGENLDWGNSIIQTSDGGYAIAGTTISPDEGIRGFVYVVKLDAHGNLQWTKTIGGPETEEGRSLIQTSDGGYAITGSTTSFGAGEADVYIVKLDANGNLQWTKTIGGPETEEGRSLIQTSDGGYVIAGSTKSFGAGEADVYVVKLDANGNLQWTKTIGGPSDEEGNSIIQTSDGGYAITGYTTSFGAGKGDVYVVKLDANGNLQWTKTIGGKNPDIGYSLIQTSDGGYAITGSTTSFGAGKGDVYVVKLDANGNLQWTKTIGGPSDEEGSSIIQTSDGGYAIAGTTSFPEERIFGFAYVVKLNANGRLQWAKIVWSSFCRKPDGGYERGSSIIETSDSGYAIAGTTDSFLSGGGNVYIVKLDANGDSPGCADDSTPKVGSGGRLSSPTSSIGSGGTLNTPTSSVRPSPTLDNLCP